MCDSLINYADHTFDIVIIARPEFLNSDFASNKQTLKSLLSEIGIN